MTQSRLLITFSAIFLLFFFCVPPHIYATKDRVCSRESTINSDISVCYPITNNLEVNKSIETLVIGLVTQFKNDVGIEPITGRLRYMLDLDFVSSQFSTDIRSFEIGRYDYTGGAHPNQDIITRTYNLNSGKAITLADLFRPGTAYLDTLSRLAQEDLRRRLGDTLFKDGLTPDVKNFSRFTLNERELVLLFPPYQVASYADGRQEVRIHYYQLKGVLRPEFLNE